jgi:hypothetical protein
MRPLCLLALLLSSCTGTSVWIREQAEFELQCPYRNLEARQLNKRTWGVAGCGKRVVYHHIKGVWVRAETLPAPAVSLQ